MGDAERDDLEVLAAELGRHCKFLPAPPSAALAVLGQRGRMMRHLLRHSPPAHVVRPVDFVRLSEERIERLGRADARGGVRGHGKGRHVGQLLARIGALGRLVQELRVLEILRESLEHGQRLGKIDLKILNKNVVNHIKKIF